MWLTAQWTQVLGPYWARLPALGICTGGRRTRQSDVELMARSSKVEPCMFCDSLPCECLGVKKAAPKKRAVKFSDNPKLDRPIKNVELPEPSTMRSAMKAASGNIKTEEVATDDEETVALRVLLEANILHPDEWLKYGHLVSKEERIKAWKERRHA